MEEAAKLLEILNRDGLCLRIVGLCNNLGHHPFLHTYDACIRASYKNKRENPD